MSTAALEKINCLIGGKWLQLPLVAMELLMIDVINKAGALYYWIQAKRHIMRGGKDTERDIQREGDSKWAHVSNHWFIILQHWHHHTLLLHTTLPSQTTWGCSFLSCNTSLISMPCLRTQGSYDNLAPRLNIVLLWVSLNACLPAGKKKMGFLQSSD